MIVGTPTKLNLIPSGVMPVVYINQGDAGYDKEFLIYNGDTPYNVPSGVSATIRGTKADNYGVTEAAAVTTGSNLVTITITEQMVAAAGENLYELVFVDTNGLRVASSNMVWAVKRDALGDSVISDSDLDYASQVLNQLQSVQAFKAQLDSNTANIESNADDLAAETAARIAADNTLQANINAEASSRSAQDGVLQAQIDQLVAPTGSAPSAAEVQNARIGADGVTYSTLGDAIRTQISNADNEINKIESGIGAFTNLWDESAATQGYYYANGAATASAYFKYSEAIKVAAGEVYYFGNDGSAVEARFVNFLTPGGANQTTLSNVNTITVPSGVNVGLMRVTFDRSYTKAQINKNQLLEYVEYGGILLERRVTALETKTADIDGVTGVLNAFDIVESVNLLDLSNMVDGYVNPANGAIVSLTSQKTTKFVPVPSGDLCFSTNVNVNNLGLMRYAFYNASEVYINGGTITVSATVDETTGRYYQVLTAPANAAFIRMSASTSAIWNVNNISFQLEPGTVPTPYEPYGHEETTLKDEALPASVSKKLLPKEYKSFQAQKSSLSDAEYILIDETAAIKKSETITFGCDITSFTSIIIGWTRTTPDAKVNYVEITATEIQIHGSNSNGPYTAVLTHGISIQNNIQIRLTVTPTGFEVELISDGSRYKGSTDACFKATSGKPFIQSSGSTLTGCTLSWVASDIDKIIWMFGDSYFGITNTDRWMYYCQEDGYANNALIDAYAGRNSSAAVAALRSLIKLGTPDFIVWCMGMNDGSDADANSPNAAWVSGRTELLSVCDEYGVTPVFATIPNVPSISHVGKNAWVKSSGYRYVDFAEAVGAASAGSSWYSGMLSTDNVHPTAKGALALYGQFLVDFPEITIT